MGAIFQGDELLLLLAILLLILGPSKLPALARGLGQAIREFRKASSGFYDTVESGNGGAPEKKVAPPKGLAEPQAAVAEAKKD
jgi:sec-independent protein translocase protein TatA